MFLCFPERITAAVLLFHYSDVETSVSYNQLTLTNLPKVEQ